MSIRVLSAPLVTLLSQPDVVQVLLLELMYPTPVRACSGTLPYTYAGNSYLATGTLGSVEPVRDSLREVTGLRFTLSGVPSEQISLALGTSARNVPAKMRVGYCAPADRVIVEGVLVFSGVLDQMTVNDDPNGNTATLAVSAIHMGKVFGRPRPYRYTEADQQIASPGDSCLRFLVSQAQHKDVWPNSLWGRQ